MPDEDNTSRSGELISISWDETTRTYSMSARAGADEDWRPSIEFPENEVDIMMGLARDMMTGG